MKELRDEDWIIIKFDVEWNRYCSEECQLSDILGIGK
jgi:hypothetical protein